MDLNDFPAALKGNDLMPWEETALPTVWSLGNRAGTPLINFPSNALVRMRGEIEATDDSYFQSLIAAIDQVLYARQGL